MKKYQKRFALLGVMLLVVSIALVCFVCWFVWHNYAKSSNNTINSFDECVAAGYAVMESYPERCSVPGGETFTNTRQVTTNNITTIPNDWHWFESTTGVRFAYPKSWGTLKENELNDSAVNHVTMTKKESFLERSGEGGFTLNWYYWDSKNNILVMAEDEGTSYETADMDNYKKPVQLGAAQKLDMLEGTGQLDIYTSLGNGSFNCGTRFYYFPVQEYIVTLSASLCDRDGEFTVGDFGNKTNVAYVDSVEDPLKQFYKYINN